MNGNPTAEQKRFHDDLREMYFDTQMHNGIGELHHIFGSKEKFKLLKEADVARPGEWFVIMIPKKIHDDIDNYSFESERGMFFKQQRDYLRFFEKPSPMPDHVINYYTQMLSKQHRLKMWEC
jgi:hypothetical protein